MEFSKPPRRDSIQALVEVLKSVAVEEHALAVLADSQAKKIMTLVRRLERENYFALKDAEIREMYRSASSVLRTSANLQTLLQTKARQILEAMDIDPAGLETDEYQFSVVCCGEGVILNTGDDFCGGKAFLKQLSVEGNQASVKQCRLNYSAEKDGARLELEVLPGTLAVKLPIVLNPEPEPEQPNKIVITGRGRIIRKMRRGKESTDSGVFQLTVWHGGCDICGCNAFQMAIAPERDLSLRHDSGQVSLIGVAKIHKTLD